MISTDPNELMNFFGLPIDFFDNDYENFGNSMNNEDVQKNDLTVSCAAKDIQCCVNIKAEKVEEIENEDNLFYESILSFRSNHNKEKNDYYDEEKTLYKSLTDLSIPLNRSLPKSKEKKTRAKVKAVFCNNDSSSNDEENVIICSSNTTATTSSIDSTKNDSSNNEGRNEVPLSRMSTITMPVSNLQKNNSIASRKNSSNALKLKEFVFDMKLADLSVTNTFS